MTNLALIAEITAAFQSEPTPGDATGMGDNSDAQPEGREVREAFRGHRWQAVPDEVLEKEQAGLPLMSNVAFKHYLPAFMCSLLRDGRVVGEGMRGLLALLKLPTEVDSAAVAEKIQRYELAGQLPDDELDEFLQSQLTHTNKVINAFIARAAQFTPAQGRAIYHFLTYARDESANTPWRSEADLAIQRYWFQFA